MAMDEAPVIPIGSTLGNCHQVESYLGQGSFGFVCKCRNIKTNKMAAIKVNKNAPDIVHQAALEIAILKQLRCLDPDTCNIVKWNGFFFDKDRICLDFELLDQSLRDYMEGKFNQALSMTELRPIIHQLATALFHLSSIGIIHADLKPDNIMVVDHMQQPLRVKLIDFGLARPVSAFEENACVQTICYMAPEVIIDFPFNEAIDMWSLGVTAAEMATGYPLYPGDEEYDVLNFIINTQGQPADDMLDRGLRTHYYFKTQSNGQQRWRFTTPEELMDKYEDTRYFKLKCLDDLEQLMVMNGGHQRDRRFLLDLIKGMMHLDPNQRIKPLEVLQHPFFADRPPQNSDTCIDTIDIPEKTPEVSQQSSGYQTAGPDHIHCTVESSSAGPCKEITDNTEDTPEDNQQSFWIQTAGPENINCRVDSRNASKAAELEDNTEEVDTFNKEHSKTSFQMAMDEAPVIPIGSTLGNCHQVESYLGQGSFGFVCKCRNIKTNKMVAVKVNKNAPDIVHQAALEIAILKQLRCLDPDTCNIVKWNGFFFDKDRICLDFELLDQSLRDYMEGKFNQALSMTELRPIIHQLATALSHLSSIGIIHADLKPDNIMVVDRMQQPLRVKLIDFGLARPVSAFEENACVQTICYMAPEVIIDFPFNEAIDMWSLGVTAAEMAIGYPLYPGDEEYDVLNFIIDTQGQPADDMLDRGLRTHYYFKTQSNGQQRWRFTTPQELMDKYEDTRYFRLKCLDDLEQLMAMNGGHQRDRRFLLDLIKGMMHLDPNQRIKPLEVLQHPFFADRPPQSSDTCIDTIDIPEKTPEVSQQSSGYQTAGPDHIHCTVESSSAGPCKEITDNTEDTPEDNQQSFWIQTAGPENINCRVDSRNASQAAELEDNTEEVDTFNKEHSKTSFQMAMDEAPVIPIGSTLGNCHQVESYLGQGSFGFVCKCRNIKTNKMAAVKVNKNAPDIVHQAALEIAILKQLRCLDPDTCNIVKWNGFFFDKDRICLDFELLDQSLRDYMEGKFNQALSMTELRPIIHQLATALSHLSSIGIIHADLKPDNIMVVDRMQQPLRVKLIDFGLARPVSAFEENACVQTICYMAPEVIIDFPFNEAIDMWSLGVTAAEMAIGYPLYPGDEEYDVLNFIIDTQGQPADDMLDRGLRTHYYFKTQSNGQQRWRFTTPEELMDKYEDTRYFRLKCLDDLEQLMVMNGGHQRDCRFLLDLIKGMMHLDPNQRIKPLEVLQHPFFADRPPQSSDTCIDTIDIPEKTPEVSQQSSGYQTAGPDHSHCTVESSSAGPCKEIIDNAEDTPENNQQSFWIQTAGPENINCRVDSRNASQAAELEDNTEEVDTFNKKHSKTSFQMAMDEAPVIPIGSTLGECHQVESYLGQGSFGFVCKCRNIETNKMAAIKVNKNAPDIVHQAGLEIAILTHLRCLDPDTCNIVKWNGFFFDKDRICLDFELLDQSLRDYMESKFNQALSMTELRPIIHQLATALSHLSSIGIIHADLKPDNVMVVDRMQQPLRVKLIDFGLARPVSAFEENACVQTIWYMAPEVIIDFPFNEAIDMWSLGVTAVEMATGYPLYPGDEEYDVLNFIIDTQGQPADDMLDRGLRTHYYFKTQSNGQQRWRFTTPEELTDKYEDTRYFRLKCLDDLQQLMAMNRGHQSDHRLLVDLIKGMMILDPNHRIKPLEVLQHPFFADRPPQSSDTCVDTIDIPEVI